MSLRARLVVGAAAAVALAVILASALIYLVVGDELHSQVDSSLVQTVRSISPLPTWTSVGPNLGEFDYPDHASSAYFQLVYANGTVVIPDEGPSTSPKALLSVTPAVEAVASGTQGQFYFDTTLSGSPTRVLVLPVELSSTVSGELGYLNFPGFSTSSTPAAIEVTASLAGVDHELAQIRLWLLLLSLGGVAVAAGAGFLVARSTLQPVRELSNTAERVRATRDLSERISVVGSDELSQLARTFNEMLAALDDAAQRQQRLVQDASHELRTPLTSLRTNIEVLAEGRDLPPGERTQLLRDVITQLGELTALVSELTDLARGEEQEAPFEEVRLDLVAAEAVARTLRNHPEVRIESDFTPTVVIGSAPALERAIGNLLDNAAKWSPPDSPIEIAVSDSEVTVSDRGPGISEADAPHIFERFYRATSARGMPGSGLGLSIVRRVAETHGGTIVAEPAPGGGTRMRLGLPSLPFADASQGEGSKSAPTEPPSPEASAEVTPIATRPPRERPLARAGRRRGMHSMHAPRILRRDDR